MKPHAPWASPQARRDIALSHDETVFELAADNTRLREGLATAEKAGIRRDLINQELSHRIGNLITVVGAIARKTFRDSDPVAVHDFAARLNALAAAQRVLIEAESSAAVLGDIVSAALQPHGDERSRVTGPELHLDGARAHALTLALHELATNAAKYGALSTESGWVEVEWSQTGDALDFHWREHDGPRVTTPVRSGFGSQLITRNLAVAFAGDVALTFDEGGVECRLRAAV